MAGGSYVGITQYLAAEQQPPHLAAITPAVAISDLYRDGFAHGGIPNLASTRSTSRVQGAPGAAGTNTDPALLAGDAAAPSSASRRPGTIAFDYLDAARRRRLLPRPLADLPRRPDQGPGARSSAAGATACCAARPRCTSVLAQRKGVETRLYMDPCTHKGCGAPFAPLTDPPGRQRRSRRVMFEFLDKHLLGAPTPERARRRGLPAGQEHVRPGRPLAAGRDRIRAARPRRGGTASAAGATGEQYYVTNPAAGFSMAFDRFGTVAGDAVRPDRPAPRGPAGPDVPHAGRSTRRCG